MPEHETRMPRSAVLLGLVLCHSLCCLAEETLARTPQDSTGVKPPELARPLRQDVAWPWKSDPDFLQRRNEAIEELRKCGRLHIEHSKSERTEWLVRTFDGTPTDDILKRTLPFVPELKRIEMNPKNISAEGFSQLRQLKYLDELLLNACRDNEKQRVDITAQDLRHIGENPNLRLLVLVGCMITDDELAELANLAKLKSFWINKTGLTPKCFRTIAKWPALESLCCLNEQFDRPIDRETHDAIASLNGRVTWLHFGEWDAMALHPSLIPAVAEIKSLRDLWIGDIRHLTAAELEPLTKLPNLRGFDYEAANNVEHEQVLDRISRIVAENHRRERQRRKPLL